MIYWQAGDYIGIGPGAHGRLTLEGVRYATETGLEPLYWLLSVEKSGTGESSRTQLSAQDRAMEYLLMGLRLQDGIDLDRLGRMSPNILDDQGVARLVDLGLLERAATRLHTTRAGRPVLNAILRDIIQV
jgi:oxygen-independent coproporphyrinogen-3 oxidase